MSGTSRTSRSPIDVLIAPRSHVGILISALIFRHSTSIQTTIDCHDCGRSQVLSAFLAPPAAITRHSFLRRAKRTSDEGNATVGKPTEKCCELLGDNELTPFTKGFSADSDQSFVVALSALRKARDSYAQLAP
jgi:hypothetical protein